MTPPDPGGRIAPSIQTDLMFLGFPVRCDPTMPRYAIDLVNSNGQRIRIDLRYPDPPVSSSSGPTHPDRTEA